jgi:hypothetical protein
MAQRAGVAIQGKTGKGKQAPSRTTLKLRRRAKRWLRWALVVIAAGIAGLFFYQRASNLPGTYVPSLGNAHIQSASEPHQAYNSDPPTSGPHLPSIASWGIHTAPVAKELQVHNLEDGGVVVQYNCRQACPELVEQLGAVVRRYQTRVVLAPYPGMEKRIALTAWTRIDTFDEFDEKRIARFVDAYRGFDHHGRR